MSRHSAGQRWCSLVLLAVFLSLFLFYGLPAAAFRIGRAIEAGRFEAAARSDPVSDNEPAPTQEPVQDDRATFVADASRDIRPAVVRIEAAVPLELPEGGNGAGPRPPVRTARGCGVIIDHQGFVLTSRRLIARATQVAIRLSAYPSAFPAQIAGSDAVTDLAVLKFDPPPEGVPSARWGAPAQADQEDLTLGEYVMAVGNAYQPGDFVWIGVVSSCGRRVSPASCGIRDCIHTTAVNPFNCGGPLINRHGAIVGINTSLRYWGGVADGAAVPAAVARHVVGDILRDGCVCRGWLGLFIHRVAPASRATLPRSEVSVDSLAVAVDYVVPDSPAEEGGLRAGDVLLRFAGAPFDSAVDLRRRITGTAPDKTVAITFLREGTVMERPLVVGRLPSVAPALPGEREWGIVLLDEVSPEESKQLVGDLPGVVVRSIAPHCKARGLAPGDVIVSVNGVPTPSLEVFCREVGPLVRDRPATPVRLEYSSSGVRKPSVIAER
jgi:serine protease Do